jgi:hypothetical protein
VAAGLPKGAAAGAVMRLHERYGARRATPRALWLTVRQRLTGSRPTTEQSAVRCRARNAPAREVLLSNGWRERGRGACQITVCRAVSRV